MKQLALMLTVLILTSFAAIGQNKNPNKIDTLSIMTKTDSIAATELKKYDEKSLRRTGVPLSIVHYDKQFKMHENENLILISYDFNKAKFYGPNSEHITVPNANDYPYHFQVSINLETSEIKFVKGQSAIKVEIEKNLQMDYLKIIDDFVSASHNNLSFQNGVNVLIDTPKDDNDALKKGFNLTHVDDEQNGGWKILAAKDVLIEKQNYRAVLYEYKNKQYIILYKKENKNKYYLRIFNARNGDGRR